MVAPILSTATLPVAETLLRAIYLAITTPTSVVMSRQPSKEDAQPTMEMAPTMSMVLVTIGPTDVRFVNSKIRSEIWRWTLLLGRRSGQTTQKIILPERPATMQL
jgi:hypothetical protein